MTARARGREELARALAQRGFSPSIARGAVERLEQEGWLDDSAAARAHVRARGGRYGRARLERELSERGFSRETIARALPRDERGAEDEALRLVLRKLRAAHAALPPEKRRRRIWNALLRRGFAADRISEMMKGSGQDDEVEGSS